MLSRLSLIALFIVSACTETLEEPAETDPLDFSSDATVIDFGLSGESSWYSVNDTVMGGVSTGDLTYTEDSMVFEGVVSTDSNGGFTSVRSETNITNLSSYDRLILRLRSEGQPFTVGLSHNAFWFQGQYRQDIPIGDDGWQVIELALNDFELINFNGGSPEPTGELMSDSDRRDIQYIELMSELFQDGDFRIEVDLLAFD